VEIPNALYLQCPECRDETLHEVLKGRGSERRGGIRLTALVKCGGCGAIRTVEIKEEARRSVPTILSDEGRSTKCALELEPSSVISVGDIIMLGSGDSGAADGEGAQGAGGGRKGREGGGEKDEEDEAVESPEEGMPCLVTAIEVGTRRVPRAKVSSMDTVWLKRFDRVKLKVSVNTGRRTISRELWAGPEERFEVGDILTAGDMQLVIHSMNTGGRRLKRGIAAAKDIRRIYGREVE
jgi:uncharacterized Zn finger protein